MEFNTAYHTLTIVKASDSEVRSLIRSWIATSKFQPVSETERNDGSKIEAFYSGASPLLQWTDASTATAMEILTRESGGQTAVSIYHHTTRFFFFTGTLFGNILQTDAERLVQHLVESTASSR